MLNGQEMSSRELDSIYNIWVNTSNQTENFHVKNHLGKIKSTPKANFYLTESSISGDYGFWCPKSAIAYENNFIVEIHNWCNIKIIEYKR